MYIAELYFPLGDREKGVKRERKEGVKRKEKIETREKKKKTRENFHHKVNS